MDILDIQKIIIQKTYTKADYLRRMKIIREYLENRFYKSSDADFTAFLHGKGVSQHDREAIGALDEHFFNLFTKDNFYNLMNDLTDGIKALPVLTLYLAISVDNYFLDELGQWFRKHIHPELIVEVHCNPNLVAGAAYVWNNQYHDISLRNFFIKKEDLITRIVDSYGKNQL